MPPVYRNPATFKVGTFDAQHKKNLSTRAKKVERLYQQAIQKIAAAAQPSLFGGTEGQQFSWQDFPQLEKEMAALQRELAKGLQLNIEQGDTEAWSLSNAKNDAMVASIVGKTTIPKATLQQWNEPNLRAMNAFIQRKEAGMGLSQRVWNLTGQFKAEMELALETCIGKGMSAAEISREVRQYLKYPDKLFRRVRDEQGNLRLSKAAAAFHPGQGVYRSSYKNALRMTATENNMAYRSADHERWGNLPFVLGIMISTSNNHPVEDICDELAGRYPKDFKFVGWHPWCRCYAVAILADQKEMDAYTKALMNGEDVSDWKFTGEVTEMPEQWNTWMQANAERIGKAHAKGNLPYFIRDNFTDGDPNKGLRWMQAPATTTPSKPTPQQIGAARHARRTQAYAQAIIDRRNEELLAFRTARNVMAVMEKYGKAANRASYKAVKDLLGRYDIEQLRKATKKLAAEAKEYVQLERTAVRLKGEMQGEGYRSLVRKADSALLYIKSGSRADARRLIDEITKEKANIAASSGTTTSMGVTFLTKYTDNAHLDKTLQNIDDMLAKGGHERWFAKKGKVRISLETDPRNNGSTYGDGRILLTKERLKHVKSAFGKIGRGMADKITYDEADAMATLWHEITHNRNKAVWRARAEIKTRYMELANEFVARATLPEFYGRMGVSKMPHPEFMTRRTSTSYDRRVRKYSEVVDTLKLDRGKVTDAVKKYLFNEDYDTQLEGLIKGLKEGGIKHLDGTPATRAELEKIMDYCQDDNVYKISITRYLQKHKFIK